MVITAIRTARWPFGIVCFLVAIFLLSGAIFLLMKYQMHRATQAFHQQYETSVAPLMPQAIQDIQQSTNDWLLCTELGLSLAEKQDSPAVLAAWIAYYQVGSQYCQRWWQWPTSKCTFLRSQRKTTKQLSLLERKIALCDVADMRRKRE